MKNIIDVCKDFGFEVPADKLEDFNKAVAENYKTVSDYQKQVDKAAREKTRADTAEETLKGFDGKDYDAIIHERDEWKRKHDENEARYIRETEEREFNDLVSAGITEANGKNAKAIAALLDLDTLRKSKNQKADVAAALETLKTENGYLFEDEGGKARFTKQQGGNGGTPKQPSRQDIMAIKDRDERRAAIAANMKLFDKGE